ncbi:MAG: virulence RhuM family protein [Chlorobiaceae bacterium]|nr:virulence RhuM family protein [Chlorobiaceae bacterium]
MTIDITPEKGEIVIYLTDDGSVQTEVRLVSETLWLSQKMMSDLFDKDTDTIGLHLKNIFHEQKLDKSATTEFFSVVQTEGKREVTRKVRFYNLDAILSVGYRVNSKRGTQFRIWANRILKEHLVKGYTINKKRLLEQQQRIEELKESIAIVERSLIEQVETIDDARAIMRVLSDFARGLEILDDYDHETLATEGNTRTPAIMIGKEEFMAGVEAMRREFDSGVFGKPKDSSFESSVRQIYQSFGGNELYSSIEHKAAMLLYLAVKNHRVLNFTNFTRT